jgi:hypothetical protein
VYVYVHVHVCVCVCVRERERERELVKRGLQKINTNSTSCRIVPIKKRCIDRS